MEIFFEELNCDPREMSEASNGNDWAELMAEALAEIFRRLPFEDRLRVVPQVCKSWNEASYNPACWIVVDMEPWLYKKAKEDFLWVLYCECKVDHLVKAVVDRSCGQLRELRTMHISSTVIDYITERCPGITFQPMSNCSIMVPNKLAINPDTSSLEFQSLLLEEEELETLIMLKMGKKAKLSSFSGEGGGEFRSVGSDFKDSASASAAAIAGPIYLSDDSSSSKQGNIMGAVADANQEALAQLLDFLEEEDASGVGTSNWQPHNSKPHQQGPNTWQPHDSKQQQKSLHDLQLFMRNQNQSAVTRTSRPGDEELTFDQIFQQAPPPTVGDWGSSKRLQAAVWTNNQRHPTTGNNSELHDSKQSQRWRAVVWPNTRQQPPRSRPGDERLTFDQIFQQAPIPTVGDWGSSKRLQAAVWTNNQQHPSTSYNSELHDLKQSQIGSLHQQMMSTERPLHEALTFEEIFEQSPRPVHW